MSSVASQPAGLTKARRASAPEGGAVRSGMTLAAYLFLSPYLALFAWLEGREEKPVSSARGR